MQARVGRRSAVLVALATLVFLTRLGDGTDLRAQASASGTTYYVSRVGSDTNSGMSPEDPWRTVSHGLASLFPGDTLYIRAGHYTEDITGIQIRPATSSARTVVTNFPGERPVIEGLLWLHDPSWWILDGINVTWNDANPPDRHMVRLINGIGWTVRNSEFWGARSYAALLVVGTVPGQPAGWTVTGNCIHDTYATNQTNQDQLIYVNTGLAAGAGLIENNLLFNAVNGMGIKLGGPAPTSGGASSVTMRRNTIHNTSQNIMVAWGSHDNMVERNILSTAEGKYSSVRGYQVTGVHNTMRDNVGYAARSILLNDIGYLGVMDAGGNRFPVDPQFDSTASCSGFHPLNPDAADYGYRSSSTAAPPNGATESPPLTSPGTTTLITTSTSIPTAPTTSPSPTVQGTTTSMPTESFSRPPACAVIDQRLASTTDLGTRQILESLSRSYGC